MAPWQCAGVGVGNVGAVGAVGHGVFGANAITAIHRGGHARRKR